MIASLDAKVEKSCPVCGAPMKKRSGRYGEFWPYPLTHTHCNVLQWRGHWLLVAYLPWCCALLGTEARTIQHRPRPKGEFHRTSHPRTCHCRRLVDRLIDGAYRKRKCYNPIGLLACQQLPYLDAPLQCRELLFLECALHPAIDRRRKIYFLFHHSFSMIKSQLCSISCFIYS